MFLWIPSGSMECPEGVPMVSLKAVLMSESCMSRGILLMQYQGTLVFVCYVDVDVVVQRMLGPHFSLERMVLASFGFLGVSARPPRTKNWVLVISMFVETVL